MQLTKKYISLARLGWQNLRAKKRQSATRDKARLVIEAESAEINLLPQAVKALIEILEHLSEGREVTVSAQPIEFSTQQAAEHLRVSRPFLVGPLEKGEIPFRKVGIHRCVLFADLRAYKEQIDRQRYKALEELTALSQELVDGLLMNEPIAVLDACVLYPALLRDLLMHLALVDVFRTRWTEESNNEWIRNLLAIRPDLTPEQLERLGLFIGFDAHLPLAIRPDHFVSARTRIPQIFARA
jgi:excisionase family DNA binding protein